MIKSISDMWNEKDLESPVYDYVDQFSTLDALKFHRMLGRAESNTQDWYDCMTEFLIRLWTSKHGGGDD